MELDINGDAAALLAAYAWADSDDPRVEALSITFVRPDDGRVPARLPTRRELPGRLTVRAALDANADLTDFAWGAVLAQVDALEDWAVVVEPNGWALSMQQALEDVSAGGMAVNVFWNVNALITFSYARDGVLVRAFDGLLYDSPDEPLPEERGFPWGVSQPRASVLAVMERLTGARIDRAWLLETPRRTFEMTLARETK